MAPKIVQDRIHIISQVNIWIKNNNVGKIFI